MEEKRSVHMEHRLTRVEEAITNISEWIKETKEALRSIDDHMKRFIEFSERQKGIVSQQANLNAEINEIRKDYQLHIKEDARFQQKIMRLIYIGYGVLVALQIAIGHPQILDLFI
jgi:hypothetical protein